MQLWLGLACFVPLAVVALDPLGLLRKLGRGLRRGAAGEGAPPEPPAASGLGMSARAWLPALLMAMIGTGLIGLVIIR